MRGHKRELSAASVWMFLIGLGGQTQVHFFGSIGISELPIYFLAPIIFFLDFHLLRRDGFLPWIWLTIFTCVGCVISAWVNDIYFMFALKGLAMPYSIFAVGVVFHRFLRRDFMSFRWFLIGLFISGIICTFIFQPETYTVRQGGLAEGDEAYEMMITHPLFWASRITAILKLPVSGWYLNVPHFYAWAVTLGSGVVSLIFSKGSGRGAFGISVMMAALIFIGGKSAGRMRKLGKNIWLLMLCGVFLAIGIKAFYKYAATSGMLGEDAARKYEKQTGQGDSMLKILMAGRKEFFISMIAAIDKPIFGHGSKGEDTKGYTENFLAKYGDYEDYDGYIRMIETNYQKGITYKMIPTHSYIGTFWVFFGIFGLLYWLYVLFLIWRYFSKYSAAVPQWFGYLCFSLVGMVWGIFFSPYGERLTAVLPIVCILFAKAVTERRFALPLALALEADEHREN